MTEMIKTLNAKYSCTIDIRELSAKYLKVNLGIEKRIKKPDNIIIPDKSYVKRLIEELEYIRNRLGVREYNYCKGKLDEILNDGDFDDREEIMNAVHEVLKKYIYESDTKVKNADWKFLEEYLKRAGYEPVSVNAGDRIRDYAVYFEQQIPANDRGKAGTIKLISQRPYILKYYDGDSVEKLKLCGKCTVYK